MFRKVLIYLGGALTIIWGIAHVIATGSVVQGLGVLSPDSVRIITMEWITEGMTLMFIGVLVIMVTLVGRGYNKSIKAVYLLTFIMLGSMSLLSLFTGFGIDFLPYKLCPVIFTISGLLILQGYFAKNSK